MGIEFTGLDDKTRDRLQQQIETMAAESETPRIPRAEDVLGRKAMHL